MTTNDTPKRPRGFAAISPERRSEIARQGGKAAHAQGRAHEFTSDEAREAGRKGGAAIHESRGPDYMRELGRRGGLRRGQVIAARAREEAGRDGSGQ